jgi:hypothetical protein
VAPRILLIGPFGAALALHGLSAQSTSLTLTVSNPYCTASQPQINRCSINIRSVSVNASDSNFYRIVVSIDGKVRLVENTFFETSTYYNHGMAPDDLAVVCGLDGQGGNAGFGLTHTVNISAYVSGSSPLVDSAAVTCPPASDRIFADGFEPGGAG